MKCKTLIFLILFFIKNNTSAQITTSHSITFEFSSPTLFSKYPYQSSIYKLGYEWRRKGKRLTFGTSIKPTIAIFRILPDGVTDKKNVASIRNYGSSFGVFLGKIFQQNLAIDLFFDYGHYYSAIILLGDGNKIDEFPASALNSFSTGLRLNYKWKERWRFNLKLAYDRYQDANNSFLLEFPAGFLFYRNNRSPVLANGFSPSIGIDYIFKKK